jgi:hypothetical protein
MKTRLRLAAALPLMLLLVPMVGGIPILMLAGCSLFPQIRTLPVPKPPAITKKATPEELVDALNKRWAGLETLTATVDIQASVFKSKEGLAKDYPTLRGHILMRKPAMLRVLGSYLGVRAFDMASNGDEFTLSIPTQKRVIKGLNKHKSKSVNALENLRPDFFLDSLLVRGLEPEDEYMVVEDSKTDRRPGAQAPVCDSRVQADPDAACGEQSQAAAAAGGLLPPRRPDALSAGYLRQRRGACDAGVLCKLPGL